MGLFNSIISDLYCPVKDEISRNTEIQIKWQHPSVRGMSLYHVGDVLEEIEDKYNDTSVRTDFICNVCSKFTRGSKGTEYIKTDDQSRHKIFVRIENGEICQILSEDDFNETCILDFSDDL